MKVWIKLSDPVYQLPEVIADSAKELAEKCGVSPTTISSNWIRYRRGDAKYSKYIMVIISEEDEDG